VLNSGILSVRVTFNLSDVIFGLRNVGERRRWKEVDGVMRWGQGSGRGKGWMRNPLGPPNKLKKPKITTPPGGLGS